MWNIRIREIYWYVHMHRNPAKHWRLSWFRYETFISFLTFRFSTRGESDTIFTMLTDPSKPTARGASRRLRLAWPRRAPKINSSKFKSQLTAFFQNTQESLPIAPGHDVIHIPSPFLSGVFIMTPVIVISSPREREHMRSMCTPTRALSRKYLSLTKLKDKI